MSNKSEIIINGMQIKSIQKLKRLAVLFDEIEKEFGVHTVKIAIQNCFICCDIKNDLAKFNFGATPMERTILEILDWN
ncbi:hypothetical protein KAJ61_05820 [Candidatus Parcubacteria bacterium]|nr:hypothetical protein [Candidatus Parcubacteria bacterium]